MKRKIYLTLGYLSLLAFIYLNVHLTFFVTKDGLSFWSYAGLFFITTLLTGVMMLVISFPFFNSGMDPFYIGVVTRKYRKIYHSELGEFYICSYNTGTRFNPGDTKVQIYHQGYLATKELFEMNFKGDTEQFRKEVKEKLDYIYKDILKSKKIEKSLDTWDGYLDKKSKRDDILTNKLNIK